MVDFIPPNYKLSKSRNLLYTTTLALINDLNRYLSSNDDQLQTLKIQMSSICFAMDMCTIHVGGRRQLGHTTMINNMMHSSSQRVGKYNSLAVTKNVRMAERLFHLESNDGYSPSSPPSNGSVYAASMLEHLEQTQAFRGIDFELIDMDLCLVDNASMMSREEIEYIYKTFHNIVKIFVMIQ